VAIVGAGRARESAVVHDSEVVVGRLLPLSLTFDHRAVTGGEATRFLVALVADLERAA
jgi:pyruvate dehydrogenase E2 component (dihydrolipoamide acetyltransferase)